MHYERKCVTACMYMCVSECVHVFISCLLLFSSRVGRTRALRSECKIDRADFTDWMSFLPSNLVEKTSPISVHKICWKVSIM